MKYLDRKPYACDGKQQFTKERADAVAERTRRKKSGGACNAYKCKVCGHWHVGHKRK
jgi:hypothetical protein